MCWQQTPAPLVLPPPPPLLLPPPLPLLLLCHNHALSSHPGPQRLVALCPSQKHLEDVLAGVVDAGSAATAFARPHFQNLADLLLQLRVVDVGVRPRRVSLGSDLLAESHHGGRDSATATAAAVTAGAACSKQGYSSLRLVDWFV